MKYKIFIKKSAKFELTKLNRKIQIKIASIIDSLKDNPLPNKWKKLKGRENIYRIRYRNLRIIYSIKKQELIIEIIKIGKRNYIYKNL